MKDVLAQKCVQLRNWFTDDSDGQLFVRQMSIVEPLCLPKTLST